MIIVPGVIVSVFPLAIVTLQLINTELDQVVSVPIVPQPIVEEILDSPDYREEAEFFARVRAYYRERPAVETNGSKK